VPSGNASGPHGDSERYANADSHADGFSHAHSHAYTYADAH
jgi:hypothetical protein